MKLLLPVKKWQCIFAARKQGLHQLQGLLVEKLAQTPESEELSPNGIVFIAHICMPQCSRHLKTQCFKIAGCSFNRSEYF